MKREDFKNIKNIHFTTCEILIENGGACDSIDCVDDCPFSCHNSTNDKMCCDNGYATEIYPSEYEDNDTYYHECDTTLLKSCRLFLETFKKGENK